MLMIALVFQAAGLLMIAAGIAAELRRRSGDALMAAGNLSVGIGDLTLREWGWAAVALAAAALIGWTWWRRRRRRSPRSIGAKARARLAALVKALRDSLRPRPVLRPVPGGAR
jgi:hypothetical protein